VIYRFIQMLSLNFIMGTKSVGESNFQQMFSIVRHVKTLTI